MAVFYLVRRPGITLLQYVVHVQGKGVGHAVDVHGVVASGQTVHVERDGLLKGNNFSVAR